MGIQPEYKEDVKNSEMKNEVPILDDEKRMQDNYMDNSDIATETNIVTIQTEKNSPENEQAKTFDNVQQKNIEKDLPKEQVQDDNEKHLLMHDKTKGNVQEDFTKIVPDKKMLKRSNVLPREDEMNKEKIELKKVNSHKKETDQAKSM